MFRQDGREAFDRSKHGTMHNDWPAEARLELLFLPGVLLSVILIGWEDLRVELCLLLVCLGPFLGYSSLLLCRGLALILQVEANRLLEVDLDRSALVLPLQGIVDLAIDFGSVEGAITMVERPGQSRVI